MKNWYKFSEKFPDVNKIFIIKHLNDKIVLLSDYKKEEILETFRNNEKAKWCYIPLEENNGLKNLNEEKNESFNEGYSKGFEQGLQEGYNKQKI